MVRGSAIPLIEYDPKKDLWSVNEDAVEYISSLTQPIGAITVVGKYRTGKSTLFNRALLSIGKSKGFPVGATVNAVTKGLYIFSETMECVDEKGNTFQSLIIDTEGLGDTEGANETHDARIFSLALLLSSYLILNTLGTIDEQSMSTLSLVTEISKEVHMTSERPEGGYADEAEEVSLGKIFPKFMWLVRDFHLDLDGMTPKEWLERSLADKEGTSEALKERNRTRRLLRTYFPQRTCSTLVSPVDSHEKLKDLDALNNSQLNPHFVKQIKTLRTELAHSIPRKTVIENGPPVNGPMFVALCRAYVTSFNAKKAPVIRNVWSMISELRSAELVNDALGLWDFPLSGPMAPDMVQKECDRLSAVCQAHFEKSKSRNADTDLEEPYVSEHRSKLMAGIQSKISMVHLKNSTEMARWVSERGAELERSLSTAASIGLFRQNAYEPTKTEAERILHISRCMESEALWGREMLPRVWSWAEQSLRQREQQCAAAFMELEASKRLVADERARYQSLEAVLATRDAEHQGLLSAKDAAIASSEQRVGLIQQEMDSLSTRMRDQTIAHEEQLKQLQQELCEERERCEEARNDALQKQVIQDPAMVAATEMLQEELEECRARLHHMEEDVEKKDMELAQCRMALQEAERLKDRVETLTHENAQLLADLQATEKKAHQADEAFANELRRISTETAMLIADTRETQDLEAANFAEKERLFKEQLQSAQMDKTFVEKTLAQAKDDLSRCQEMRKFEVDRLDKDIESLKMENIKRGTAIQEMAAQNDAVIAKIREEASKELKVLRDKLSEQTSMTYKEKSMLMDQLREAQSKAGILEVKHAEIKRKLEDQQSQGDAKRFKAEVETLKIEKAHATGELAQLQTVKRSQQREIDELRAQVETLRKQGIDDRRAFELEKSQLTISFERRINECRRWKI